MPEDLRVAFLSLQDWETPYQHRKLRGSKKFQSHKHQVRLSEVGVRSD
jgi:hypothetical protein